MTEPTEYLRSMGEAGDGQHDIARAALMLSALDHPGQDLHVYEDHLDEIAKAARSDARLAVNAEDGARALAKLMAGHFGYDGDRITYDDPQNADLMAVIDRRRGLPVALGILYIHAARAAGFEAAGLNAPNHFLLHILLRGHEAVLDPFNGGAAPDAERLGGPPRMRLSEPEDHAPAQAVSDIDVLLRLQNNLKLRALNLGERARALEIARRVVLVAPRKPELWMDLARLNEANGVLGAAQQAYDTCLTLAQPGQGLHNEAALSLQALKRRLN
jgi:regulator of sirC expression with transglutaminase-like and TPR domain